MKFLTCIRDRWRRMMSVGDPTPTPDFDYDALNRHDSPPDQWRSLPFDAHRVDATIAVPGEHDRFKAAVAIYNAAFARDLQARIGSPKATEEVERLKAAALSAYPENAARCGWVLKDRSDEACGPDYVITPVTPRKRPYVTSIPWDVPIEEAMSFVPPRPVDPSPDLPVGLDDTEWVERAVARLREYYWIVPTNFTCGVVRQAHLFWVESPAGTPLEQLAQAIHDLVARNIDAGRAAVRIVFNSFTMCQADEQPPEASSRS